MTRTQMLHSSARRLAATTIAALLLSACASTPSSDMGTVQSGSASASVNQLTAADRAAGWRSLFDGQTLAGWRGLGMSGVPTVHLRPTFFSEWLLLPFLRSSILVREAS